MTLRYDFEYNKLAKGAPNVAYLWSNANLLMNKIIKSLINKHYDKIKQTDHLTKLIIKSHVYLKRYINIDDDNLSNILKILN